MSQRKARPRGGVSLPKGVHHVVARAKSYYYFQSNQHAVRGSARQAAERPAERRILARHHVSGL
jgi:hypothetical protein